MSFINPPQPLLIQSPIQHPKTFATVLEKLLFYKSICLPTRSLWGPLSTEFQFHETLDLQFVQPS